MLVSILLNLVAIPGLFAKSRAGWKFVYFSWLLNLIADLVGLSIIGFILSSLIGGFFLFQIRNYYTK